MVERLQHITSARLTDVLSVVLPNATILAAVNLVSVNHLIQLVAGLVTLAYAVWRWRRDSFVLCRPCLDGRPPATCPYPPNKRPAWCPKKL